MLIVRLIIHPNIYVRDPRTNETSDLLNLNPQFRTLRFGKVETITWNVQGVDVTAGLYLPPDYVAGHRYPLVIQTHGFDQGRFTMDGRNEWSSGFAARPLAAKGIVVLQAYVISDPAERSQVGKNRSFGNTESASYRTFAKLVYESAIDYLDQRGIIDPDRVGISGFSRTEWFVAYTLTHTDHRFRAAILTDGIDAGYFQYLTFRSTEAILDNGGLTPFSDAGLKLWMKESPGFNLDKVRAPVRLVSLDTGEGILESWEWFTGLRLQKRPVDLVAIPDGAHLLQRPRDREIVMNGIVDWFSFWLQGKEDSDPYKTAQYQRWRVLRKLDEATTARSKDALQDTPMH